MRIPRLNMLAAAKAAFKQDFFCHPRESEDAVFYKERWIPAEFSPLNDGAGMTRIKNGFSLVELSIVLVILGLLVGGVLSGQSLIRAAELRSVSTDYSRYVTALQTFSDKYSALPGDMNNATIYWGTAHATPATCVSTVGTGTQTCNGNADGKIDFGASSSNEWFRAWQQLANSGLIEGSYNGVTDAACGNIYCANIGTNVPRSKLSNAGWTLGTAEGNISSTYYFPNIVYGIVLMVGVRQNYTSGPLMKPEEAWNIDKKMDDGIPSTGRILTWNSNNNPGCTTNDTASSAYVLTSSDKLCSLIFRPDL